MITPRRTFLEKALLAGAVAMIHPPSGTGLAMGAESEPLGIPGPYRGRVIAVGHSGAIVSGAYQTQPIEDMMQKGMTELTGAPNWVEAWRVFFRPGDVVGIKVSPVGGPGLCSDAVVLHR